MKSYFLPALLIALLLALALRLPDLDTRPLHNDEAVNAIKVGQLWQHHSYRYDPSEYHGPTLIYAARALIDILRVPDFIHLTEANLRLVAVLFGVALIICLPLVKNFIGETATLSAAFLIAISPAFVFYSRYFIHEMLLVFFSFFAIASLWNYFASRKMLWALAFGFSVGLMHTTKETFLLPLFAIVASLTLLTGNRLLSRLFWQTHLDKKLVLHLSLALAVWLVTVTVLFSSFFTNWPGVLDSVRTYAPWLHRAGGASPHIYGWNFYFKRLLFYHVGRGPLWSEGLILLLALTGIISVFRSRSTTLASQFQQFLIFYTMALTVLYCAISYKTPWCMLGFWHGFILLAGLGGAALLEYIQLPALRFCALLLLLAFATQLAWQSWQQNTVYAADYRNPYVYAQTSADLLNLVDRVNAIADNDKKSPLIKVIAPHDDYWPLPWYLRRFDQVGWYNQFPPNSVADLTIISPGLAAPLDSNTNQVMIGIFALRRGVFLQLYADSALWNASLSRSLNVSQ